MKRALFLVILTSFLFGCSSDDEDSPIKGYWIEVDDQGHWVKFPQVFVITNTTFIYYFGGRKSFEEKYTIKDNIIELTTKDYFEFNRKEESFPGWTYKVSTLYLTEYYNGERMGVERRFRQMDDAEKKAYFPN